MERVINLSKIKVSKELYDALEDVKINSNFEDLLKTHACNHKFASEIYKPFNDLKTIKLAEILINGYEIEETPEEILIGLYNSSCINKSAFDNGYKLAVEQTLRVLGIKIKGIND